MSIESIELDDVEALKNISERCLAESVVLDAAERRQLIEHTASNIEQYSQIPECLFLKYVRGGSISGYILVKKYWNLSDLFVLPECQGIGIGRELLGRAIEQVKASGKSNYIWVNSSQNAELFYRKLGFQDRTEGTGKSDNVVPLKYDF